MQSWFSGARALLRSGADPNYCNGAGDLTLFWAIDGGAEMIKVRALNPPVPTPLS